MDHPSPLGHDPPGLAPRKRQESLIGHSKADIQVEIIRPSWINLNLIINFSFGWQGKLRTARPSSVD